MRLGFGLLGMVLLAASAHGVGGVVSGNGAGILVAFDNSYTCTDMPFHIDAAYLPGSRGVLNFYFVTAGPGSCPFLNGGGTFLGRVHYDLAQPSVRHEFSCAGTEANGMVCESPQSGFTARAWVGPHAALGSTWVVFMDDDSRFDGTFTAV